VSRNIEKRFVFVVVLRFYLKGARSHSGSLHLRYWTLYNKCNASDKCLRNSWNRYYFSAGL